MRMPQPPLIPYHPPAYLRLQQSISLRIIIVYQQLYQPITPYRAAFTCSAARVRVRSGRSAVAVGAPLFGYMYVICCVLLGGLRLRWVYMAGIVVVLG